MVAGFAVGLMQLLLDLSVGYAKERKSFGKLIVEHQVIGPKLAKMQMRLEAAWLIDQGNRDIIVRELANG